MVSATCCGTSALVSDLSHNSGLSRVRQTSHGVQFLGRHRPVVLERRRRVCRRICPHSAQQFFAKLVHIDPVSVASVGNRMKDADRTTDAKHSTTDHHPDRRRPATHDLVDRHVGIYCLRRDHGRCLQRTPSKPSIARRTLRGRKQRLHCPSLSRARQQRACGAHYPCLKVADEILLCVR